MKSIRSGLVWILSAALILLSPGFPCYQALAGEFSESQAPSAAEGFPAGGANAPLELSNFPVNSETSDTQGLERNISEDGPEHAIDLAAPSAEESDPSGDLTGPSRSGKDDLSADPGGSSEKSADAAAAGKSWRSGIGATLSRFSAAIGVRPGPVLERYLGRFYDRSSAGSSSDKTIVSPSASSSRLNPLPKGESETQTDKPSPAAGVPLSELRVNSDSPAALSSAAPANAPGMNKKAVWAWIFELGLSVAAFILITLAFPHVAIPLVGRAAFNRLLTLGPGIIMLAGPLLGMVAQRFSVRASKTTNAILMAASILAMPVLSHLGFLSAASPYVFWALLLGSFANSLVLAVVLVIGSAYLKLFAGSGRYANKNLATLNAVAQIVYLPLQFIFNMGALPGIPSFGLFVHLWRPMTPFYLAAAVMGVVALVDRFLMPRVMLDGAAPPQRTFKSVLSELKASFEGVPAFFRLYAREALLTAAAMASFIFLQPHAGPSGAASAGSGAVGLVRTVFASGLPIIAASLWWGSRLSISREIWETPERGWSMVFSVALRALMYPVQYFALPLIAIALGGPHWVVLLAVISGVFFLGQLLGNSTQVKLPDVDVSGLAYVKTRRFIQAGVLAMATSWVCKSLAHGHPIAAAAALVFGVLAMVLGEHTKDANWVESAGFGMGLPMVLMSMAFLGTAPLLAPLATIPALLLGFLAVGYFYGPATVVLDNNFQKLSPAGDLGNYTAVRSLFNAGGLMLGYYFGGLTSAHLTSVFLGVTLPFGGLLTALGLVLFLYSNRYLPSLYSKLKDKGVRHRAIFADLASYRLKKLALAGIFVVFGHNFSPPSVDAEAFGAEQVQPGTILAELAKKNTHVFDYDNTVADNNKWLSQKMVDYFVGLRRAGKNVVIITNRSDQQEPGSTERSIFDLLSTIPPRGRAGIIVAARAGARIYQYDGAGKPRLMAKELRFDQAERSGISQAAFVVKERLRRQGISINKEILTPDFYQMRFKPGIKALVLKAAAAALEKELRARRLDYAVSPRMSKDLDPCLMITRSDKFTAASAIKRLKKIQPEDVAVYADGLYRPAAEGRRFIPRAVSAWAYRLGERLSGAPMPETGNDADAGMVDAFPGSLVISLGRANPSLRNTYVAPEQGPKMLERIAAAMNPLPSNQGLK